MFWTQPNKRMVIQTESGVTHRGKKSHTFHLPPLFIWNDKLMVTACHQSCWLKLLMLLTCKWEVLSSNLIQNTHFPDRVSLFPSSIWVNTRIIHQIRAQLLTSVSFGIHYLLSSSYSLLSSDSIIK
jgi:hypothetical protein